jgi:hypothetical protein
MQKFHILFTPLKEMTQALLYEKFGNDAVNLLRNPLMIIRKVINQNQHSIMYTDRAMAGDVNSLNLLRNTFVEHDQNLQEMAGILKPIVSTELIQLFKYFLLDKTMDYINAIQKMWRGEPDTIEHIMLSIMYELQGSMFEKLHTMLVESGEGQRLPNLELHLNSCLKSVKEAYNIVIPLVRLLTLEYEKRFANNEEVNKVSVKAALKLMIFMQNMWDQVSNSQLQYKEEPTEAIQAAAKFNEETLNTIN